MGISLSIVKIESAHALEGVSCVAFSITTDEQLQKNRVAFFPMQVLLFKEFPLFSE